MTTQNSFSLGHLRMPFWDLAWRSCFMVILHFERETCQFNQNVLRAAEIIVCRLANCCQQLFSNKVVNLLAIWQRNELIKEDTALQSPTGIDETINMTLSFCQKTNKVILVLAKSSIIHKPKKVEIGWGSYPVYDLWQGGTNPVISLMVLNASYFQ